MESFHTILGIWNLKILSELVKFFVVSLETIQIFMGFSEHFTNNLENFDAVLNILKKHEKLHPFTYLEFFKSPFKKARRFPDYPDNSEIPDNLEYQANWLYIF